MLDLGKSCYAHTMTNALILHGKPSKKTYFDPNLPSPSNSIWIPWLQHQLLLMGIPTQTPEMFDAWQPDYRIWSKEFERYTLTRDTLLVGHSCGAGFIVQWLSEHPDVHVGHIFLVAPSFGDRFTPEDRYETPTVGGFFEFDIDSKLQERIRSLTIFHSDNDSGRVNVAVRSIKDIFPGCDYRQFPAYGHFRSRDMPNTPRGTFPELLKAIDDKVTEL